MELLLVALGLVGVALGLREYYTKDDVPHWVGVVMLLTFVCCLFWLYIESTTSGLRGAFP